MSQDKQLLSYSTKELTRDMQKPTEQSMTNLKCLRRYLKKRPQLEQLSVEHTFTRNVVWLDVHGDCDHAGGLKTRKSTTSRVLMRDAHCLKMSKHTQSTISLSKSESEYYGIVKCVTIGSGARSMLSDFGLCADVVVRTDSSSGLSVGSRQKLDRLRHVQTRFLRVQQRVQQGELRLKKEPGDTNDALTKPLDEKRMRTCWRWWVTLSEKSTKHWRRKRSDELEVEERSPRHWGKLQNVFTWRSIWCFSNVVFSPTRFFETIGIAHKYSGTQMMIRNAGNQMTTRITEKNWILIVVPARLRFNSDNQTIMLNCTRCDCNAKRSRICIL